MAEQIKGAFRSIHASGEIARGLFNNTMDSIGDGIANRESGEVDARRKSSASVLANGRQELDQGMGQMRGEHVAHDPVVSRSEVSASGTNASIRESEIAVAEHRQALNTATDELEAKLAAQHQTSATSTGRGHPINGTHDHVAAPSASPSNSNTGPPLPPRHPDTQGVPVQMPQSSDGSKLQTSRASLASVPLPTSSAYRVGRDTGNGPMQMPRSLDSLEHDLPPSAAGPSHPRGPEIPHTANTSSVPTAGATDEQPIRSAVV